MAKIDAATIEKYQALLQKDPQSQVFAPLAEAYREMKMLKEAERTARDGMKRHPNFVSGLVTFARIMRDLGNYQEALAPLKKAVQLAPENILGHQLMAEIYLANRQPKESLKAFKMVLFLNPQSKTAQNAISKLESLTADEYDDEVFEMTQLNNLRIEGTPPPASDEESPFSRTRVSIDLKSSKSVSAEPSKNEASGASSPARQKALERMLSLIDAFIVRNDLEKAYMLLKDTQVEFGTHPEINKRFKSLQVRNNQVEEPESATPLRPLGSRHQQSNQKKLQWLNAILDRIEHYRESVIDG